jgi:hypothetical protein
MRMSKSDFDQFVKRQQAEQQELTDIVDAKRQHDEWIHYLGALYGDITRYLESYISTNQAQIDYRDIRLNEEFIGTYVAREMLLKIGRSTVTFTPIGTMLIGMKGRVEVQGSSGTASLILVNKLATSARSLIQVRVVRVGNRPLPQPPQPSREEINKIEWMWKISTPPPEMKFIELTQDTFYDMILEVSNG